MVLSEKFFSLQGEGLYVGVPSLFLRASTCNLRCNGLWKCDTWDLLSKGQEYTVDELISWIVSEGYFDMFLHQRAHLVLTGGEPFMDNCAKEFIKLLQKLKTPGICFTEIETNGTIMNEVLFNLVDHITCSPKLSNSGVVKNRRFNTSVLKKIMTHKSYCFKFVISEESDLKEIKEYINELNIPLNNIYLMPGASTRQELLKKLPVVWDICQQYGFRLSTRLHLSAFDKKTGI